MIVAPMIAPISLMGRWPGGLACSFPSALPALADLAHPLPTPVALADAPLLVDSVTETLAFADQAGTLAGALFPASLPPYLLFLYFICQDVNGLSSTAKAGFTSLLGFVTATVVTSIVATKGYGQSLANVDWLHSGAEQLLSFTNIANVIGLKLTLDAFSNGGGATPPPSAGGTLSSPVLPALAGAGALTMAATWAAAGGDLGAHTAYLGGIGNLPPNVWTLGFTEPANALSLPTWVIHVSSLLEWLVAMGLVWRLGTISGNPRWKGLTWAMIPSHSSGVCACVYHFFYNADSLQFVVLAQAALTLLGNITLAFAAWRLAASNGWSLPQMGFGGAAAESDTPTAAPAVPTSAARGSTGPVTPPSSTVDASGGDLSGLLTIFLWSIAGSYLIKYGETLLPFVNDGDSPAVPILATAMIASASAFNVWKWQQRSQEEEGDDFRGLI